MVAVGLKTVFRVLLALELRVAVSLRLLKEHLESPLYLLMYGDQRLTVDFFQERRALLVLRGRRNEMLARGGVELLLVGQHLIPEVAATAERLFKERRLFGGGMEAHFNRGISVLFRVLNGVFSLIFLRFPRHAPPPSALSQIQRNKDCVVSRGRLFPDLCGTHIVLAPIL